MRESAESLFTILYLAAVMIMGVCLVKGNQGKKQYLLYGSMAITLGLGDLFLLISNTLNYLSVQTGRLIPMTEIGRQITAIAITLFYLMLYYFWRVRYQINGRQPVTEAVWGLSIFRIILCFFHIASYMMPGNPLTDIRVHNLWEEYQIIPLLGLGILLIRLFYQSARNTHDFEFQSSWMIITVIFICYACIEICKGITIAEIVSLVLLTGAYLYLVGLGCLAMRKGK